MAEDFMAMYKQALERLSTGGMSLEASLQEIEEGKIQAISRGQQSLVSGGLAGATVMGGVPLQAEKIAAGQRLGARGRAEETYLTTLASYAAFAQRAQEAQSEREAAMERLQTQIDAQEKGATTEQKAASQRLQTQIAAERRATTLSTMRSGVGRTSPFGQPSAFTSGGVGSSVAPAGADAGGYADQFPSIYDQGGMGESIPNWTDGGVPTQPTVGGGDKVRMRTYLGPEGKWNPILDSGTTFANPMAVYGAPGVEGEGGLGAVSDPTSPVSRYAYGAYGGGF